MGRRMSRRVRQAGALGSETRSPDDGLGRGGRGSVAHKLLALDESQAVTPRDHGHVDRAAAASNLYGQGLSADGRTYPEDRKIDGVLERHCFPRDGESKH